MAEKDENNINKVFLVARRRAHRLRQPALPTLEHPGRVFGVDAGVADVLKPWQAWQMPIVYMEEDDRGPLNRKRSYNHALEGPQDPELQDLIQLFERFSLNDQQPATMETNEIDEGDSGYDTTGWICPGDEIYDEEGVVHPPSAKRHRTAEKELEPERQKKKKKEQSRSVCTLM